jgi:peptidoglycan/LPS O-acetylase OafA/YrhL
MAHTGQTGQPAVFPLIDGIRGFAALTVLVYHLIGHWDWAAFPSTGPLAWFRSGWMAVDLFFVISGFVIGLSAFNGIDTHGAGFRAGFLRSRLARIVPLHYLTLVAYVLLVEPSLRAQGDFWTNLGTHLLFIHNLFSPYHGSINGPNWSLGTEMQFYLLIAFAAPWLRQAQPWRIALLLVAIAWAWRWGAWALTIPGSLDQAYYAQTQLPGMLDAFAIGLLLARFVRSASGATFLDRVRADARIRYALTVLTALCWWALFTVYMDHHFWNESAMAVFFRTALACCSGATLLLACAWPMPKRSALVGVPLYLGKVSYGIYLWHLPVLFFLGQHTRLEPLTALAIAVPATIGLAALTWHLFEEPVLRRWGKRPAGSFLIRSPRRDTGLLPR